MSHDKGPYCYARRFHEMLGLGAGSDFERQLAVKPRAAQLLDASLRRRPELRDQRIHLSGATDCYQPLERDWQLTRACLAVCVRRQQPVSVITRSPLVVRDLDLLLRLDPWVAISIPLLDRHTCQALEPWAPPPSARLDALAALADAGVPVGVLVNPVIPGLAEPDMTETLRLAAQAGATWGGRPGCPAGIGGRGLRASPPPGPPLPGRGRAGANPQGLGRAARAAPEASSTARRSGLGGHPQAVRAREGPAGAGRWAAGDASATGAAQPVVATPRQPPRGWARSARRARATRAS